MTSGHRIAPVMAFVAMVVNALARRGGRTRRWSATAVVVGLATTTAQRLAPRAVSPVAPAAAVAAAGWAVERIGTATGLPFGRYAYTGRLRPTVAGVPVLVPLAWFAMAGPAREAVHAALGAATTRRRRVLLGAAAMTAWDLFLDPQMVAEGYWRWVRPGRYRGIPWTNFAGWFVASIGVMAVLEATAPIDGPADVGLVAEYAGVAAMETLGFATFFGDRTVAAVGGAAMLPLAAVAVRRVTGRNR